MLPHPPYSPDMTPADYFMFLKWKVALKGTRFYSVEEIKTRVTAVLKTVLKEEFLALFQQLCECFKAYIERGGVDVENEQTNFFYLYNLNFNCICSWTFWIHVYFILKNSQIKYWVWNLIFRFINFIVQYGNFLRTDWILNTRNFLLLFDMYGEWKQV